MDCKCAKKHIHSFSSHTYIQYLPPSTALPVAGERLFPRVPPQVGLQVAALGVHLGAARKSAFVHFDKIRHWVLLELLISDKNT